MNSHFNFGVVNPLKYFVFVSSALGVLFALIKNDEQLGFGLSLIHWQLQTVLPVLIILLCYHFLLRFSHFNQLSLWWRLALAGVLGSTLFTPLAFVIDIWIGEELLDDADWWWELIDEWGGVSISATVAWLMINWPLLAGVQYQQMANHLDVDEGRDGLAQHNCEPVGSANLSYEILTLAGIAEVKDLIAMTAQLHYVDVYYFTSDEQRQKDDNHQLVLYSLKDAAQQLPQNIGMQVHRSHWVAFAHIHSWTKQGRQGEIKMSNGLLMPISRNNLVKFVAAYEAWQQR